ncbi:unnamed protein product [Durusdinium trenchii]|uniref:Uncharacterized protein n=2 Tax=Durusdinium trenchii TaxID=1381693 RepID=A0ABP0IM03_9DINO
MDRMEFSIVFSSFKSLAYMAQISFVSGADLCAEIFDLEQFAYSDHVELERKSTRRKDRPPPPPPASTFGRSEALEEELGSESDGEESEDDDALLQRLKLAQQVAPQLFSKSPS